jgi:hypothetical protein
MLLIAGYRILVVRSELWVLWLILNADLLRKSENFHCLSALASCDGGQRHLHTGKHNFKI